MRALEAWLEGDEGIEERKKTPAAAMCAVLRGGPRSIEDREASFV
jgi:hypothetical protein